MMRNQKQKDKRVSFKRLLGTLLIVFVIALVLPYLYLPEMVLPGTGVESRWCPIDPSKCELLIDSTGYDPKTEKRVVKQEIFDEILAMIERSESFIVADFFLFNPWKGSIPESQRALSSELASALIAKKRSHPEHRILLLTDPINRIYGQDEPEFYSKMAEAGIQVVFTDLERLPHSNMLYSPVASFYGHTLSKLPILSRILDKRMVDNVFEEGRQKTSLLQFLRLLHFKANHRKLIVTDNSEGKPELLATSFNPADGSSAHSNIGILAQGAIAQAALETELKCIEWSSANPDCLLNTTTVKVGESADYCRRFLSCGNAAEPAADEPRAKWLTEEAIRDRVLRMLSEAGPGDKVAIAMFYCSDRTIVRSIADAAYGGAEVRLILDANKDAFGREKTGIPNRPAAAEILELAGDEADLEIRWAATHGEQFHTKAMSIVNAESGKSQFICGSANWTRRNVQNLNLESCFYIENASRISYKFNAYFNHIWHNEGNRVYTLDYDEVAEQGWSLFWKTMLYVFQEESGASTF